jgi:hypothetical protein
MSKKGTIGTRGQVHCPRDSTNPNFEDFCAFLIED